MDIKRILFIINPSAGQQEPVTEHINKIFDKSQLSWLVHELKKGENASEVVSRKIHEFDLVAVYGGDGSVTESAAALIDVNKPLAIIPGGTANVLAKELGIPLDTKEALQLIRDKRFLLKTIDTGLVNGKPFLLRVNLGIMADMIIETDPDLKDKFGRMAYGISAIKTIHNSTLVKYSMIIDGIKIAAEGASLTVTNCGNMGMADLQLYPGIDIADGLLDIVLLKDAGLLSIIKATGASLFENETVALSHWTCRKVTIQLEEETAYLEDDCERKDTVLNIEVVPASLNIVVPFNHE